MSQKFRVCAVVVAAGSSSRVKAGDKLFLPVEGEPVLLKTLRAFEDCPIVDGIVIVTREEKITAVEGLAVGITKCIAVVRGGTTRAESALCGVRTAEDFDLVLVQDGARPFVSTDLITRVAEAAAEYGAAVPVVPVKDTVKTCTEEGFVSQTPDRATLFAAQTPQGALRDLYLKAAEAVGDLTGLTDDASLMEAAGYPVKTVIGEETNRKITTDADFGRKGADTVTGIRMGHGYDVHRLVEGRPLRLGGVTVPFELGLDGHSDADVLLHAICDALLGAAALGDIGLHFSDRDPKFKDIDSRILLRETYALVKNAGFFLGNLDATVLCQRPKLRPYIDRMRAAVAEDLGVATEQISIKATTEEGLGFTGTGEGIAAHAVAVLVRA